VDREGERTLHNAAVGIGSDVIVVVQPTVSSLAVAVNPLQCVMMWGWWWGEEDVGPPPARPLQRSLSRWPCCSASLTPADTSAREEKEGKGDHHHSQ